MFLLIGFSSVLVRSKEQSDYLLAGSSVPPSLIGLSAVATNNSGFMFIGVIDYTYATGLPAFTMMVGWILGDWMAATLVTRKVREVSEERGTLTIPELLSRWGGGHFQVLKVVAALIAVLLLGVYAAAQFKAGGKALQALFDWDLRTGAIIGAVMVLCYGFSGGLRASVEARRRRRRRAAIGRGRRLEEQGRAGDVAERVVEARADRRAVRAVRDAEAHTAAGRAEEAVRRRRGVIALDDGHGDARVARERRAVAPRGGARERPRRRRRGGDEARRVDAVVGQHDQELHDRRVAAGELRVEGAELLFVLWLRAARHAALRRRVVARRALAGGCVNRELRRREGGHRLC